MENFVNEVFLNDLLLHTTLPNSWDSSYKITYMDISHIINFIDQHASLSSLDLVKGINLLMNYDFTTSGIIKKPSNFKRKMESLLKKHKNDPVFLNLPVPELVISHVSNFPHSSSSLGEYCDKMSFTKDNIENYEAFSGPPFFNFTVGAIFELEDFCIKKYSWDTFSLILSTFTGQNKITQQALRQKIENLRVKLANLKKVPLDKCGNSVERFHEI